MSFGNQQPTAGGAPSPDKQGAFGASVADFTQKNPDALTALFGASRATPSIPTTDPNLAANMQGLQGILAQSDAKKKQLLQAFMTGGG